MAVWLDKPFLSSSNGQDQGFFGRALTRQTDDVSEQCSLSELLRGESVEIWLLEWGKLARGSCEGEMR